jgi:hypothetical protein
MQAPRCRALWLSGSPRCCSERAGDDWHLLTRYAHFFQNSKLRDIYPVKIIAHLLPSRKTWGGRTQGALMAVMHQAVERLLVLHASSSTSLPQLAVTAGANDP